MRAAEAAVLATHPLRLADDSATLAALLGLPGGASAEAALSLTEVSAAVSSVTAAAPSFLQTALQAVSAEQHGSEAEALGAAVDKARGMATRRVLSASGVWRGRPTAFAWVIELHAAATPAFAAAFARELRATQGALVSLLERLQQAGAGGGGGEGLGLD